MSGPRFLLTLAASSALVMVPLSGPALADSVTTRDAAHDVVSQSGEDDTGPTRPEPDREEGDALAMRVTHGKKNVRVVMRSAKLTRPSKDPAVHLFSFRTSRGKTADLGLYVHRKRRQGERTWSYAGRDRACRGLRTTIDYRNATVRAVVPRRCLSNPRWVQVGAGVGTLTADRVYADDVNRSGGIEDDLAYGPRVRRG